MPMNFRQSRFRGRQGMGEDVNPSAYIVNLADCMLVLACGFMVAMISYWNIDVSSTGVEQLEADDLQQVDPQTMPEDVVEGGSGYVEAGTVYQDPSTGQLYMVETQAGSVDIAAAASDDGVQSEGSSSAESSDAGSADDGSSSDASSTGSDAASDEASRPSDEDIRNSRALGGE